MIPVAIAKKLLQLAAGAQLPASKLQHSLIAELIEEGIVLQRIAGRTKSTLHITDTAALQTWLHNRFSIADLQAYILACADEATTRAQLIQVSNDSKAAARRVFKGFLMNSYVPITCSLNGGPFIIDPQPGTFQFVYDFEQFTIPEDVTITGVENAECFRHANKLQYLFGNKRILFVSRYPQSQGKDLATWLQSIPNKYLHMGDYDFAGINIYMQEFKQYLGERASFFIPDNIESLLEQYGNRALYDQQQLNKSGSADDTLEPLVALIHKYKRGLEQEVLLADIGATAL